MIKPDYESNDVKLYRGDCLEVMAEIPDGTADLVVTSPPYYNARPEYSSWNTYEEYLFFIKKTFILVKNILRTGCIFALNVSCVIEPRIKRKSESIRRPIPFDCVVMAGNIGLTFIDDIIWQKPDGASSRARNFARHRRPVAYKPFQITEYILIFRDTTAGLIDDVIHRHTKEQIQSSLVKNKYERTNIWSIPPRNDIEHPAVFPAELAEKIIRYYSFIGDTVLDPFMGSGTTGIAAIRTRRRFTGIELDPEYFEIARQRIETRGHYKIRKRVESDGFGFNIKRNK